MKKKYLVPDVRTAYVGYEESFLLSYVQFDGSDGEDLDDPSDPFNPWS
jgi:hypothetical protein